MSIIVKKTFNEEIFSNIRMIITEYELIEEGDLIAIALSGGKDSVLTLHALSCFKNSVDFLDFDIVAIAVNEGIEGYRSNGIKVVKDMTKKLGVNCIEKSFKEEFGYNLDDNISLF